jgi:hypothetical protein
MHSGVLLKRVYGRWEGAGEGALPNNGMKQAKPAMARMARFSLLISAC